MQLLPETSLQGGKYKIEKYLAKVVLALLT